MLHSADALFTSQLGLATHYVASAKIPKLLAALAEHEDPRTKDVNTIIEEFSTEREPDEAPTPLTGDVRVALDYAFRHSKVEKIVADLEQISGNANPAISEWAKATLKALHLRSPTSLKVALKAIRQGKGYTLLDALKMELRIATAYCVSNLSPALCP